MVRRYEGGLVKMIVVKFSLKEKIDLLMEMVKKDGIIKTSLGLAFYTMILIIATTCYLIQHTYNLLTGRGWTGMSL